MGRGGRLATRDCDKFVQTPVAGLAQDRLGTDVEFARIELVSVLLRIDRTPASECPCRLAHVALGVLALAQ